MKRGQAIFAGAALLPLLSCAAPLIPVPKYGEPSLQLSHTTTGDNGVLTGYVQGTNVTGVTMCGWWKAETDGNFVAGLLDFIVSVVPARSTFEGGDKLANAMSTDYLLDENTIPLDSSGEWSEACIPTVEVPETLADDEMQYGVFVVNVSTDTALTLNFGGTTYSIPATNNWVKNVCPSSSSKVVKITTTAGAKVHFGFAENPIVHFYGTSWSPDANGDFKLAKDGGLTTNEYRFIVSTAELKDNGATLYLRTRGYNRNGQLATVAENTVALSPAVQYFPKNARMQWQNAFVGVGAADHRIKLHAMRMYEEVFDDDFIKTMRDQDWEVMVSRGLTYDSARGDAWGIRAKVETTASTVGTPTTATDAVTGSTITTTPETRNAAGAVEMTAFSYLLDFALDNADMVWAADGATIDGNRLTFASAGNYAISGYNTKLGEKRTLTANLTAGQAWETVAASDPTASTPYGKAVALMDSSLAACAMPAKATTYAHDNTEGQYYIGGVRHIPSLPIKATAGSQGNRAYSLLSPHTFITAWHYYNFPNSTLTYTAGGAITNTVQANGGAVLSLAAWALTNGFSAADAALVGDVAVGRFANDATVDAAFCPYLMASNTAVAAFGTVLGIPAWRGTQRSVGAALPVVLSPQAGCLQSWSTSDTYGSWASSTAHPKTSTYCGSQLVPPSFVNAIGTLAALRPDTSVPLFPQTYSGDSGHPIYISVGENTNILVSHHHYRGAGDSYTRGVEILKAYITANGDPIKIYNP